MTMAKVSSKGQITLPAVARRKLGIKPHDRVVVEATEGAIVVRKAPDIFALEGALGKALPPEEEEKAIMDWAAKRALGRQ